MSSDPKSSNNNTPDQSTAEPVNRIFPAVAEPVNQAVPAEDYDGLPEYTPAENLAEATSYRVDFAAESADYADSQDTNN